MYYEKHKIFQLLKVAYKILMETFASGDKNNINRCQKAISMYETDIRKKERKFIFRCDNLN